MHHSIYIRKLDTVQIYFREISKKYIDLDLKGLYKYKFFKDSFCTRNIFMY